MSLQATTNDHVLDWKLADRRLEKPAISMSSQGVLYFYKPAESWHEYVVKLRPSAEPINLEREISFLDAAGELSVDVVSRIYNRVTYLWVSACLDLILSILPNSHTSRNTISSIKSVPFFLNSMTMELYTVTSNYRICY